MKTSREFIGSLLALMSNYLSLLASHLTRALTCKGMLSLSQSHDTS